MSKAGHFLFSWPRWLGRGSLMAVITAWYSAREALAHGLVTGWAHFAVTMALAAACFAAGDALAFAGAMTILAVRKDRRETRS